jgi:hypothetical protein
MGGGIGATGENAIVFNAARVGCVAAILAQETEK